MLDMQEAYDNGLKFYTNSLGEVADNVIVPEAIYEWYENLGVASPSLLYVVKRNNEFGIMAINEFDDYTVKECFDGDRELMQDVLKAIANDISEEVDYYVFYGKETGFAGCDEIAVFLPYRLGTEKIQEVLTYVDKTVYDFDKYKEIFR